eukprot:2205990-Ditylum_brightwellii.AAC.1
MEPNRSRLTHIKDSFIGLAMLRACPGHDFPPKITSWCHPKQPRGAPHMTYGRSLNKVLNRNNISTSNWMEEAQDRILWRKKIKLF